MAPFYGWGSTASRLEPLWGGSLLYNDHLSQKLNNPNTSAKTYWSILKLFYKGTKVSLITPLLYYEIIKLFWISLKKLIFSKILLLCSTQQLVITVPYLQEDLLRLMKDYSSSILKKDNILETIRNLNVIKAYSHHDVFIAMLKINDSALTEPLSVIFKNYWLWSFSRYLENVS